MVIYLESKSVQAPKQNRFTIKDIEDLFAQNKDWYKFYKQNENRLWESKVDVYSWPVYPLHTKEDKFYRCILHSEEDVKMGPGFPPKKIFFRNIHYAEFISHCIFYKPEEHKQYIMEKLFPKHVNTTTTTTTTVKPEQSQSHS
jgi:hypothetical protein